MVCVQKKRVWSRWGRVCAYVPIALFGLTMVRGGTVEIGRGVLAAAAAARQPDQFAPHPVAADAEPLATTSSRRTLSHSRRRTTTARPPYPTGRRRSRAFSLRRTLSRTTPRLVIPSPPVQGRSRRHRTDDNIIIVVCVCVYDVLLRCLASRVFEELAAAADVDLTLATRSTPSDTEVHDYCQLLLI